MSLTSLPFLQVGTIDAKHLVHKYQVGLVPMRHNSFKNTMENFASLRVGAVDPALHKIEA